MTKPKRRWLLSLIPEILNPKTNAGKLDTPGVNLIHRESPLNCQENSRFAQIPEDIIFLIVGHLDEQTKAYLVRTCRYFHDLLEVSLYRHITPVSPWRYHRSHGLFRTLADRQDLLPFITTYNGPLLPSVLPPPQKQKFLDKFKKWQKPPSAAPGTPPINETESFKRAAVIFSKANNIVDLSFTDCSSWTSDPLLEPIKRAVARMSLKRLSLWHSEGLPAILRDQPDLEELRLGWSCPGLEKIENTDVPKLRSLSAPLQEAACLVPGRPIERLDLKTSFGSPTFDLRLFDRLSLSTKPITHFSISIYNSWEDEGVRAAIQVLARSWPNIQQLFITVTGPISGQTILDEIPVFKSIQEVAFLDARLATAQDRASGDPLHDDGITQLDPLEDWEQIFSRLKEHCPTLVEAWHTPYIFYGCCCGLGM